MKQIAALFFVVAGLIGFADQYTDELADACYMGDIEIVRDLIGRGADINATDSSGKTPLANAAMAGYRDIYELLIEKGANYNFFDCSAAGDVLRVNKLIADGTDVNATDKFGSTALMLASQDSGVDVMEILLNNGSNIDFQNSQGRTALMIAAKNGQRKAVELLLDHNADVHIKDQDDKTALKWAQWHKVVDRVVAKEIEDALTKAGAKQ